uniref:Uncharacterized protein n=1 Tax=Rhizophora mucronata TaxID=61149 RepID=A0A2P2K6C8_RHIMU
MQSLCWADYICPPPTRPGLSLFVVVSVVVAAIGAYAAAAVIRIL